MNRKPVKVIIDEKIAKQIKKNTGTPHTNVERPSIIAGMGCLDEYVKKSSSHSSTLYSVSMRSPWNAVHCAKNRNYSQATALAQS
jgi:hypothetical protein